METILISELKPIMNIANCNHFFKYIKSDINISKLKKIPIGEIKEVRKKLKINFKEKRKGIDEIIVEIDF